MSGTWYPPTTYEPAAGTGQLLVNPPFAMSDHQDLIETACHNAKRAMHDECSRSIGNGGSPETCLVLAAALDALIREGISGDDLPACATHLRRQAAPRRAA